MRIITITAAFVLTLTACSQRTEESATAAAPTSSETPTTASAGSRTGGTPFEVPSDARARYFLLEVEPSEGGHIVATTRREGSSGTTYSRREIDCEANRFRYIGEGDTLEQAEQSAANIGEMSDLVDGSISDVASRFACSNR